MESPTVERVKPEEPDQISAFNSHVQLDWSRAPLEVAMPAEFEELRNLRVLAVVFGDNYVN